MAEVYANLRCSGMTSVKPFGILVKAYRGRVGTLAEVETKTHRQECRRHTSDLVIAGIARNRRHREGKTHH
jgi:hypothetical protein